MKAVCSMFICFLCSSARREQQPLIDIDCRQLQSHAFLIPGYTVCVVHVEL